MRGSPLPRLDRAAEVRQRLLPHCRLGPGEVWEDPVAGHRVGCLDAADAAQQQALVGHPAGGARGRAAPTRSPVTLAVQDPPYNLVAFDQRKLDAYVAWCRQWVEATLACLAEDATLCLWLGADQKHGFQPLPDLMVMMRALPVTSRSFVTLRNQRGYGTQQNWMAVRQELLVYTRGKPGFTVQYTDIPKILRGYYKDVGGRRTENLERSKAQTIRPGNVWVDVQQVFYRMEENVSGCYTQKPLKAIERLVAASSAPGDTVLDSFAHSGTTLLACERLGRRGVTADLDPVFCELTIRRLLHYRETGRLGWQNGHAFERELGPDPLA